MLSRGHRESNDLSIEGRVGYSSQTANAAGRATGGAAPSNTAQNLSGSKHDADSAN